MGTVFVLDRVDCLPIWEERFVHIEYHFTRLKVPVRPWVNAAILNMVRTDHYVVIDRTYLFKVRACPLGEKVFRLAANLKDSIILEIFAKFVVQILCEMSAVGKDLILGDVKHLERDPCSSIVFGQRPIGVLQRRLFFQND
jgi:hypothetical protein